MGLNMVAFQKVRPWLIWWMYLMAFVHFVGGLLLPWVAGTAFFDSYHQSVLKAFWPEQIPVGATALQVWWLSLFGATLQCLAIFMGVLIYIANRMRAAFVWGWMIIGFLVWAPQDIFISLQANAWMHVAGDVIALGLMLPPLVVLFFGDRKANRGKVV